MLRGLAVATTYVLLNLARLVPDDGAALVAQVRPGGVVVNTVPTITIAEDAEREVRVVGSSSAATRLSMTRVAELADAGELRVEVAERVGLADLPAVHARAAAGELPGRVIVTTDPVVEAVRAGGRRTRVHRWR